MKTKVSLDQLCINTIRTLAIDAVQKANSGHPGMPLGMAPSAYVLWTKFLKHNPQNSAWINRDRFILSAGHGSMLLYSLLHLTGYDLSLDDIKNFRQDGSLTPGHPENFVTNGVETTTGPLGQGFATGIGMAIAKKFLAARFNKKGKTIFDYNIYSIVGDGDLMEGVSYESASIAGHLKLGNIIYLYDNNKITIEGSTDLAFTENIKDRFESCGWQVIKVEDGNNLEEISKAIEEAIKEKEKPSLISIRTLIGYGSPNKQGKSSCHGSPLGNEEVILTKKNLNWEKPEETFYIPDEALNEFRKVLEKGKVLEEKWLENFNEYKNKYKELGKELEIFLNKELPENWEEMLPEFKTGDKIATRIAMSQVLNSTCKGLPFVIGGSADLAPSNNTYLKECNDFMPGSYGGRNLRFGVREHAMGAITNGISLSNSIIPYCATFFVFSDYLKPAIRLASLMELQVVYIFTHDSIFLGEDGPTHQPIEHLAGLRAIPNLNVIRPADANETKYAWKIALETPKTPTAIILSRQKLPVLAETNLNNKGNVEKGAYIISDSKKSKPDIIIMASGSEVSLAISAKDKLAEENIDARIVSFPCWELFEKQPDSYKNYVFPPEIKKRIAIEAGSSIGWDKYTGFEGNIISIDRFGASAPEAILIKKFGFNVENVVNKAKQIL